MESRAVLSDQNPQRCHCGSMLARRDFIAGLGLAALGPSLGAVESALAVPAGASAKPRVRAVFVRQKTDRYFMGWPGAAYDVQARQADYTKVLTGAAKALGVDIELSQEPVTELGQISALVSQCEQKPPDGVVLISMCLNTSWDKITQFVVKRPPTLPVIVYSPKGTSFLDNVQQMAQRTKGTGTFLASTSDVDWLGQAMRMLHAHAQIKRTRVCVVQGEKPGDLALERLGSTLRYVHFHRFTEEYKKVAIMKFSDAAWWAAPKDPASCASSILLGTGRVVRNIDNPPSGGCRTSLEVQVDGIDDVRKLKYLHHQLIILGKHKERLRAYCELAGIEVQTV